MKKHHQTSIQTFEKGFRRFSCISLLLLALACVPHELCDITSVWGKPEIKCISSSTYSLKVYFTGVYIAHGGILEKVVIDHELTYRNVPYTFERTADQQAIFSFTLTVNNHRKEDLEVFFAIKNGACTWTEANLYDEPDCTN